MTARSISENSEMILSVRLRNKAVPVHRWTFSEQNAADTVEAADLADVGRVRETGVSLYKSDLCGIIIKNIRWKIKEIVKFYYPSVSKKTWLQQGGISGTSIGFAQVIEDGQITFV